MQSRRLGPFSVSAIGLGCMNLSHAYGNGVVHLAYGPA
jgi:aryl-alcohol dehydrogenase-like predicted oxidoreductase